MENNLNENNAVETTTPQGTFTHKIGNTTYVKCYNIEAMRG